MAGVFVDPERRHRRAACSGRLSHPVRLTHLLTFVSSRAPGSLLFFTSSWIWSQSITQGKIPWLTNTVIFCACYICQAVVSECLRVGVYVRMFRHCFVYGQEMCRISAAVIFVASMLPNSRYFTEQHSIKLRLHWGRCNMSRLLHSWAQWCFFFLSPLSMRQMKQSVALSIDLESLQHNQWDVLLIAFSTFYLLFSWESALPLGQLR